MTQAARAELDAMVASAARAHSAGRLDEALGLAEAVLKREPRNAQAMLLAGIIHVKKSDLDRAIPLLQTVAEIDQGSYHARVWLSLSFRKRGLFDQAIRWASEAVERDPGNPMGLGQLGFSLIEARNYEAALAILHRAGQIAPKVGQIRHGLAKALKGLGRHAESVRVLRQAFELEPNSTEILSELVDACTSELEVADAIHYAERWIKLAPDSAIANLTLARLLMEDNRLPEAERHLERAISLGPTDGATLAAMGSVLQNLGRSTEAEQRFRQAIEADPNQAFAYLELVRSHRITESERSLVEKLSESLQAGGLSESQAINFHYALGKAREDLQAYGEAMGHYDEANRLTYRSKYGDQPFDGAKHQASIEFVKRTFDRGFFERYGSAGTETDLPIFVIGMMRSGTTLTEQILSSHPDVGPAGEQQFWTRHQGTALESEGHSLDPGILRDLVGRYCAELQRIAPGKRHVVDKMPNNYVRLGLIACGMPNAMIIHVRRHPVDTCLSIYSTPNRSRIEWLHHRESIVFAYRLYLSLMEHWREVLPPGRIFDIDYEDLVSDRERVTREMVSFCGLEWNDACMRPEENQRSVVTPSVWQVQQPVYKTSVARWKRFEPYLGAFAELL